MFYFILENTKQHSVRVTGADKYIWISPNTTFYLKNLSQTVKLKKFISRRNVLLILLEYFSLQNMSNYNSLSISKPQKLSGQLVKSSVEEKNT